MKKYKKAAISIAFLTIIMSTGICTSYTDNLDNQDKNKSKKNRFQQEMILNAFENNDYLGWKKIVRSNSDFVKVISENDFTKFVEARNAARSGQYDKSIKLSSEP
jgi:hypothetical protein